MSSMPPVQNKTPTTYPSLDPNDLNDYNKDLLEERKRITREGLILSNEIHRGNEIKRNMTQLQ